MLASLQVVTITRYWSNRFPAGRQKAPVSVFWQQKPRILIGMVATGRSASLINENKMKKLLESWQLTVDTYPLSVLSQRGKHGDITNTYNNRKICFWSTELEANRSVMTLAAVWLGVQTKMRLFGEESRILTIAARRETKKWVGGGKRRIQAILRVKMKLTEQSLSLASALTEMIEWVQVDKEWHQR